MSSQFSNLVGWKSQEQFFGKTDYDLPCPVSEIAETFIQEEYKVVTTKDHLWTLNICEYTQGWRCLIGEKKPIINLNDEIIGTLAVAVDITQFTHIIKCLNLFNADQKFTKPSKSASYIINYSHSPLPLTPRQQECLSLLIRGKTMKEIAFILNISVRTVETHLESIKHKLGCSNRSQLIEKALDSGFLFHIPASLLGLTSLIK